MLTVEGLRVEIGRIPVLRGVTLHVPEGAVVGLIGRNGAGKTTTLRALMGLLSISGGRAAFDGADLRGLPPHARARMGIGYMPEDRRLIPGLTVEENILLPAWATGLARAGDRLSYVYGLIPEVRALAGRPAGQLSGGQQKLVALARALMAGRRLVLLDEPFEGLAPAMAERMGEAIRAFAADGGAALVAESEYRHVERWAARVYAIERGETHEGAA